MDITQTVCVHDRLDELLSELAPCSVEAGSVTYGSWREYLFWVVRDPRQEPTPFGSSPRDAAVASWGNAWLV